MKPIALSFAILAASLSACSEASEPQATPATALETSSDIGGQRTAIDVPENVKVKRGLEKRFIASMEEGLSTQMLLFARVSPEATSTVKPVEVTAEDRKVLSCVYDEMEDAGLEDHIEYGISNNDKLVAAVKADPTISMATMEDHPEIYALMTAGLDYGTQAERDRIEEINAECGVMAMMMGKMRESGAMDAMMNAAMEDE